MESPPIEATTLVRDIVRLHPGAVRALDAFHVDWSCGAGDTLAAACESVGAALPDVLMALAREPDGRQTDLVAPPGDERLHETIAHILSRHHALSRAEGPALRALADDVLRMHGRAYPALAGLAELVHGLFDELTAHMEREERVLFPYIEALERARESGTSIVAPFGSVGAPIRMMQQDHEAVALLLRDIERTTDDFVPPEDASESWRELYDRLRAHDADLRRHVWLENEVLFPRAIALEQSTGR